MRHGRTVRSLERRKHRAGRKTQKSTTFGGQRFNEVRKNVPRTRKRL